MKNFYFGIVFGAVVMLASFHIRYYTRPTPLHKVGDCLSNGLFYEHIREIRSPFFGDRLYVTDYFIRGRKQQPGTVEAWLADKLYVKVESDYCMEDR